jgi:hypothetical protein
MENILTELCPICIENPVTHYTECNHGYCVGCLCRIKKCTMCRKPLQRAEICVRIKLKVKTYNNSNPLIYYNNADFSSNARTTITRNGDLVCRMEFSVTLPETPLPTSESYFSRIDNANIRLDDDMYIGF